MASGGSDLSTRRTAENWNIVKNLIYETARQHFITHKVEISGAITGIFPFLVSLRDRGFITNELYEESKKSWNNQTPVQKVVYDVLEELEKKFDLSLLKILFSKTILKSYPDLNDILEDFRYAVHEKICHQASDGKGRAGNLHTQLSFKQETGENWYQNLTWLFPEPLNYKASPENELREQLCELRQINVKKTGAASNSKEAPESQQASEQRAQASEPAVEPPDHGIPGNSCSAELTHIKTKRPFVQSGIKVEAGARSNCNPASDTIVIPSEDSTESGGGDKPPKASTSAVKRRPESTDSRTPPMSGKKLCKRSTVDPGNSSTLEKAKSTKRSEEHTDTTPKTGIEIFLVTCGEMKGMLIKRRLERGGTTKCIRREDRNWFTPREFEVVGGRGKSSNWRNTIRCCGTKLKQLMEYKILPDPPRIHGRKRKDNSNICKICLDGGTLYRCKSCRNYFHGDCHIPAVETNRSSWTCTFCTIRNSASQEHHKESEVLARPVQPAEQLKCAFLLLAAYCRLENDVYVNIPHENYNEMASKCLENLRTLDNIKKKLAGGEYTEVGAFVLAMNPILQNASASQRYDSNLIEKEFKKNFREVFAVEETSHNSSLQ
ncbi:nuclear body protein SP140-like protein isoform X5 [Saccopteryx leptura]|uniref:nuclear body protein SP140-like protein isoform X5 n=1 Tax=Saccopteryx leptura TaxID=249018 RepID=UPI00339C2B0B